MDQGIIRMGPWGGPGGSRWSQYGDSAVQKIIIAYGWAIDSISFLTNSGGKEEWSKLNGGSGASGKDEINIHFPDEYFTSISGHVGLFNNRQTLRSLTLYTNVDKYGPYGKEEGTHFSVPIHGGVIVGFHGREANYLDALGLYVKPVLESVLSKYIGMKICPVVTRVALTSPSIEVSDGDIIQQCPAAWGGIGGKPWDDGVFFGIKEIYIHSDCSVINSIELLYKHWDSTEISFTHGSSRGTILHSIELDDAEHLVSIAGYYGNAEGTGAYEVIKSLTFFTNKSKYGPIGEEVGRYFSTTSCPSRSGKVVGLFGRSSFYLDAIGVHMSYF